MLKRFCDLCKREITTGEIFYGIADVNGSRDTCADCFSEVRESVVADMISTPHADAALGMGVQG